MILVSKIGVFGVLLGIGLSVAGVSGEETRGSGKSDGAFSGGKNSTKSLEKSLCEKHLIRIAQLRTQYLQALLRLEEKLTRGGKIDDALQIRSEVERFRRGNRVPDADKTRLAKLRELGLIYSNEVQRISGEFEIEMASFWKKRGEAFASKRVEAAGDSS